MAFATGIRARLAVKDKPVISGSLDIQKSYTIMPWFFGATLLFFIVYPFKRKKGLILI